jgi:hypothetical protein
MRFNNRGAITSYKKTYYNSVSHFVLGKKNFHQDIQLNDFVISFICIQTARIINIQILYYHSTKIKHYALPCFLLYNTSKLW